MFRTIVAAAAAFAIVDTSAAGKFACPICTVRQSCRPIRVTKTDKNHCYEVQRKEICIPKFRWPWQQHCEPKCGRVKTVKVFKKHETTCEKPGWDWVIEPGCDACAALDTGHPAVVEITTPEHRRGRRLPSLFRFRRHLAPIALSD